MQTSTLCTRQSHIHSQGLHNRKFKLKKMMLYEIVLLQHTLIKRFHLRERMTERNSRNWSSNMQIIGLLRLYHPCTYFNIPDSSGKFFVDEHKTWHNWWTLMMKMMGFETVRIFVSSLNSMLYFRIFYCIPNTCTFNWKLHTQTHTHTHHLKWMSMDKQTRQH